MIDDDAKIFLILYFLYFFNILACSIYIKVPSLSELKISMVLVSGVSNEKKAW